MHNDCHVRDFKVQSYSTCIPCMLGQLVITLLYRVWLTSCRNWAAGYR